MAQKGWKAKGLIAPLWWTYDAHGKLKASTGKTERRDALGNAIGTTGNTLSAVNSGSRRLGRDLARRLADELGISVLELGAPEEEADEEGRFLLRRLDELAETVGDLLEGQKKTKAELARLRSRIRKLEAPPATGASSTRRPRGEAAS